MSSVKTVYLVETEDFVRAKIGEVLAVYDVDAQVEIVADPELAGDSCPVLSMSKPLRIGTVLDDIARACNASAAQKFLDLGKVGKIDLQKGLFLRSGNEEGVRLTEKEVALLVLLHGQKEGNAVSRDVLLEKIWRYSEGVETHTAETHIYRLRQKIEADPTRPEILKTNDLGYYLAFE